MIVTYSFISHRLRLCVTLVIAVNQFVTVATTLDKHPEIRFVSVKRVPERV